MAIIIRGSADPMPGGKSAQKLVRSLRRTSGRAELEIIIERRDVSVASVRGLLCLPGECETKELLRVRVPFHHVEAAS